MKCVMLSIQPKWCELIASGKKTVEVRKTNPKLETPFKCYIYETKDKRFENIGVHYADERKDFIHHIGKVIGEFVCDYVGGILPVLGGVVSNGVDIKETCLTTEQTIQYLKAKRGYGWHITDLVIYDKPKELSEFRTPCKMTEGSCYFCDYAVHGMDGYLIDCDTSLTRPPQSWCYVEETLPPLVEPKGKTITIPKWEYKE